MLASFRPAHTPGSSHSPVTGQPLFYLYDAKRPVTSLSATGLYWSRTTKAPTVPWYRQNDQRFPHPSVPPLLCAAPCSNTKTPLCRCRGYKHWPVFLVIMQSSVYILYSKSEGVSTICLTTFSGPRRCEESAPHRRRWKSRYLSELSAILHKRAQEVPTLQIIGALSLASEV